MIVNDNAEEMQQAAIDTASLAMEKYTTDKEIATFIKKEFDKKFDPTWHCIVGRNFGSYLTHEDKYFIHFYLNQYGILLLRAGEKCKHAWNSFVKHRLHCRSQANSHSFLQTAVLLGSHRDSDTAHESHDERRDSTYDDYLRKIHLKNCKLKSFHFSWR